MSLLQTGMLSLRGNTWKTQFGELAGYVVVALRGKRIFVSERIYHCEEMAEQEALRQSAKFDFAGVDRVRLNVTLKDGLLDAYYPTFEEYGAHIDDSINLADSCKPADCKIVMAENRMSTLAKGRIIAMAGYIVVGWVNGRIDALSERIYHCKELAEQEASRQSAKFQKTFVDRIEMKVMLNAEGWLDAYEPTIEQFGV